VFRSKLIAKKINKRVKSRQIVGNKIKTGRQHHRTCPTEKLVIVHTTVLSEPELKQAVHTTGQPQLEKYWLSTPPFYQNQI